MVSPDICLTRFVIRTAATAMEVLSDSWDDLNGHTGSHHGTCRLRGFEPSRCHLKGAVPGRGADVKVNTGEVLAGVPSPTV